MKSKAMEFIDSKKVDSLLEGFNKSTGFVTAILDLEGNVLSKSGWRQICTEFHRSNPKTSKKCTISDTELANKMAEGEKYHFYKCLNGLVDVAVPIVINGEHIANLFSGQFFFEKPDLTFFKKQAKEFGFDENKYIDALSKVPIVSEDNVKTAMDFLLDMTQLISDLAFQKVEQIELNKQIEKSEERFDLAMKASNDGLFDWNLETNEIYYSPAWKKMLGYEDDELPNDFSVWENTTEPGDVKKSWELQQKLINKEVDRFVLEFKMKHKDGHWVDILSRAEAFFNETGIAIRIVGTHTDITERKLAEEELLKSKSNLEEYFENDISADYVVSVSGEIFSCNKTFLSLFGFEKKSATEKFDITGLYKNPEDRKQMIRLVKNHGKVENYEVEFISTEGKNIHALINAIGIFDKENQLEKIRGYVVDISEQKNIGKELQKSEEKYRLLFANNPQPMWIYDLETLAFLEVNQAAVNHYGFSKEEFLSMTLKDIRPVEDIPALLEDIKNTRLEYNTAGEWRHLKKNGEIIDVEIISHSVLFNERNARHILINDITERKRVQFEYQTMIKTSRDGFWIVDAQNGKFLEVNQSYCEMIGYSREELLQMTIQDIEAVESQEETRQHIALIMEKGFDSFESKHKTKSGRIIDIDASVTFIGSDINKFFVFVKEISDRKRVENEILKLSHAVEQSPISIIITDLEGNMKYVNPKTLEITGYTKDELIGKNPRLFNSGEKPKEEYQQLWSTVLSGKEWFGEFHNKKKNGEFYWESASISPIINEKQEIINFVAIKEDITNGKKIVADLVIAKEKAEESDKLKSEFLAQISHEIRTPINAIVGSIDCLNDIFEKAEDPDVKELFANVTSASGRIIRTVDLVINMSELQTESYSPIFTNVDLNLDTLKKLYHEFQNFAEQKGLKLIYNCELDNPIILADQYSLVQIFTNLIDNAIKYTKQGKVEIILSKNNNDKTIVEIKDTGIGISDKFREIMFNPFSQEEQGYSRKYEGNGLGLSLVESYCKINNALIEVESIKNVGSTFRIIFN